MVECDPRVGRQVHYVARGSADGIYPAVCRCAHIAQWVSDGEEEAGTSNIASLVILNPEGMYFNLMCSQDQEGKAPGTWHWPEREG